MPSRDRAGRDHSERGAGAVEGDRETRVEPESKCSGILVGRGTRVSIPAGGLTINLGSPGQQLAVDVHLQLNMWFYWLEIALSHLGTAKNHHATLLRARHDGEALQPALDDETRSGMQAIMAAAIAVDALYADVADRLPVQRDLRKQWREKGTARYAQVTEVFRRAFGLRRQGTANLRLTLKELYHFRDLAVHPDARASTPVLYPDLQVGVEWRLVAFGFANAQQAVRAALAYVKILPSRPLDRAPAPVQQLASEMLSLGGPLFDEWERHYGPLLDSPSDTGR